MYCPSLESPKGPRDERSVPHSGANAVRPSSEVLAVIWVAAAYRVQLSRAMGLVKLWSAMSCLAEMR